ncbi:biopolymer transporter ExbD [Colwellia sp. E2M01]|uniref:ExbD/TolR family protein n=1 Tax=Colwellia sp. E2M01 TaxID=2841561 RepID=UPI001C09B3FA|nr:biopolymer transporter ExbD [Colwellia sp. E2M01]MBU2870778.1 biopolymer transporter ExbD [Colwellia sp. E2M01]
MRQSFKAKRLAKHHKRFSSGSKLNLVSLMDIFTILVFFLIVNQSEVRVLQNTKELNLPISIAEELPAENTLITVLPKSIMIQDRVIWQQKSSLTELNTVIDEGLIKAINTELAYLATKRPVLTDNETENGRAVTIIGDATVPYQVLKQIMAACADSDYRNISLAVEQVAKSKINGG